MLTALLSAQWAVYPGVKLSLPPRNLSKTFVIRILILQRHCGWRVTTYICKRFHCKTSKDVSQTQPRTQNLPQSSHSTSKVFRLDSQFQLRLCLLLGFHSRSTNHQQGKYWCKGRTLYDKSFAVTGPKYGAFLYSPQILLSRVGYSLRHPLY